MWHHVRNFSQPHVMKMGNKIVHITLVGGQPMPVYIGILAVRPKSIWLIHSKNSEEESSIIANSCEVKNVDVKKLEFPAVDHSRIIEQAGKLLDELKEEEVIINISSGTKPWAVAFALLSVNLPNVSLVYVDQNHQVYNITKGENLSLDLRLDINTILRYNHRKVSKRTSLDNYTDDDKKVLEETQQLRNFNANDFNELTIPHDKKRRNAIKQEPEFKHTMPTGSQIHYKRKVNLISVILKRTIKGRPVTQQKRLISPHVKEIVFNAGWFEYKVARMLCSWKHQREIWLNVSFPYQNGAPKNEIDIIVNANNKLLFIECKTQIFDITDIDKFRSAVKNYGGMSSKAIFITDTKEMKTEALQKCKDNGVMTFCMGAYKSEEQCKADLFALLEKEMLNINKR